MTQTHCVGENGNISGTFRLAEKKNGPNEVSCVRVQSPRTTTRALHVGSPCENPTEFVVKCTSQFLFAAAHATASRLHEPADRIWGLVPKHRAPSLSTSTLPVSFT